MTEVRVLPIESGKGFLLKPTASTTNKVKLLSSQPYLTH
jgi:hypothetical protein